MSYCTNCGEKTYRGLCTNCHEENFIENQYLDLNEPVPESIYKKARENEMEVYLNPVDEKRAKKNESTKL